MLLSIDVAAESFGVDEEPLSQVVYSGIVRQDYSERIDFRIAVVWSRSISEEAVCLFGDTVRLPAPDSSYVLIVDIDSMSDRDLAGEARLDLFD